MRFSLCYNATTKDDKSEHHINSVHKNIPQIARYSDGSTRVISAKPIYANVIVDEYDMEYGTVMNDYITYCRHCSYIKTGTREQSYSSRID